MAKIQAKQDGGAGVEEVKEQKPKKEKKQVEEGKKVEKKEEVKPKEEKKGEAKGEAKQDQPKKLDFVSALKATNAAEEPKRSHTQVIKE